MTPRRRRVAASTEAVNGGASQGSGDRSLAPGASTADDDDDVFIPSRRVAARSRAADGPAEKSGAADGDGDVFVARNGVTAGGATSLAAATVREQIHARMQILESEIMAAIGEDAVTVLDVLVGEPARTGTCRYECGRRDGEEHAWDCAYWDREGKDRTPF